MQKGSRYNQLIDYLKGLKYDKYIIKINELIRDPKLKFLIDESFGGYLSDDVLKFSVIDIPVRKLLPCQNEIDVDKSLKYALSIKPECIEGMFKNPVVINLPLVTFNGNFIIDGHHRWSQVYCYNINAKMTCWNYEGDFSAMQMLKMMQAAIGSNLGEIPVSKVDGINLLTAKIDKLEDYIRATAKPEFYELYAKYAGVDNNEDEIINIVLGNVESMQADNAPIKDAPERGLMPQTDKAPEVLEDIKEGVVVMSNTNRSFSREMDDIYYALSELTKTDEDDIIRKVSESDFDKFVERLNRTYEPDYVDLVVDKLFQNPTSVDDIKYMDTVGGSRIDSIYRSTGTEKSIILVIIDEVKNYLKSKGIKVMSNTNKSFSPKFTPGKSHYMKDNEYDLMSKAWNISTKEAKDFIKSWNDCKSETYPKAEWFDNEKFSVFDRDSDSMYKPDMNGKVTDNMYFHKEGFYHYLFSSHNRSFSNQYEVQKLILSIKDKSLAARVAYAIGDAQSILNFDDQYHKLDKSLKSDYENLVDKFKDCKTDSDFEDWIESYKSLIDRTFSNRSYSAELKMAPKSLIENTLKANYDSIGSIFKDPDYDDLVVDFKDDGFRLVTKEVAELLKSHKLFIRRTAGHPLNNAQKNELKKFIEDYHKLCEKEYSAPKVLVNETDYYVDIDEDRIYVKIGEHDADHEDAPYEEYTYYFDKKEWEPSLPELPYNIKKVISDYIKDDSLFSNSDRSDDDKYHNAYEKYRSMDYSKRSFSIK